MGKTVEDRQHIDQQVISNGPCINDNQWEALCRPVADEEVKAAIFSISDEKSPGPDGFTSGFFKSGWNVIGADVCLAVQSFFQFR